MKRYILALFFSFNWVCATEQEQAQVPSSAQQQRVQGITSEERRAIRRTSRASAQLSDQLQGLSSRLATTEQIAHRANENAVWASRKEKGWMSRFNSIFNNVVEFGISNNSNMFKSPIGSEESKNLGFLEKTKQGILGVVAIPVAIIGATLGVDSVTDTAEATYTQAQQLVQDTETTANTGFALASSLVVATSIMSVAQGATAVATATATPLLFVPYSWLVLNVLKWAGVPLWLSGAGTGIPWGAPVLAFFGFKGMKLPHYLQVILAGVPVRLPLTFLIVIFSLEAFRTAYNILGKKYRDQARAKAKKTGKYSSRELWNIYPEFVPAPNYLYEVAKLSSGKTMRLINWLW